MNRTDLCRAFCDDLSIREVPAGLAVSTPFMTHDGDRIGFYVVREHGLAGYRIQDDGLTLPSLEASGVDFRSGTRGEAREELLTEYGVRIDDVHQEFHISDVAESDLPGAALKFVAFALRVRDFKLMTEYRVATTSRDDAKRMLTQAAQSRVSIEENVAISPGLADFTPDFVLRAPDRPVGVFLGTTETRILEALFLQMRAVHELHETVSIVALLEKGRSINAKVRQQAVNRLNAVPEFRGDEVAATQRIVSEAIGSSRTLQ